jgi:hypothetical protein
MIPAAVHGICVVTVLKRNGCRYTKTTSQTARTPVTQLFCPPRCFFLLQASPDFSEGYEILSKFNPASTSRKTTDAVQARKHR